MYQSTSSHTCSCNQTKAPKRKTGAPWPCAFASAAYGHMQLQP